MLHLFNDASIARALSLDLDSRLNRLLTERIAALVTSYGDLTDHTEFLVVEPFDIEVDIVRHIGFSPLVEPIDGIRFGEPGYQPSFDWLTDHGGWFELIYTFGSTFAYVVLIQDEAGVIPELRDLCRRYVAER